MLSTKKKSTSLVGLDIESGSIAATEVRSQSNRTVGRTAIVPLEPGVVREGDLVDGNTLSDALKDLFGRYKLGKRVRLGVANQRVIVRTLELPLLEDPEELASAVRFRAQDAIPMPLDQAVLDHRVIAKRDGPDGNRMMDVLAVAARRDMVVSLVQALRNAGLEPAGIDLSAFGMIRALDEDSGEPPLQSGDMPPVTTLYCHLGDITNLAVARGGECLFTRVSPFGMEAIADRLAGRQEISMDDARELLMEVGLEEDLDLFDRDDGAGAARDVLEGERASSSRSCGCPWTSTAPRRVSPRWIASRSAGPAAPSRGCRNASRPGSGSGSPASFRGRSRISIRRMPRD